MNNRKILCPKITFEEDEKNLESENSSAKYSTEVTYFSGNKFITQHEQISITLPKRYS